MQAYAKEYDRTTHNTNTGIATHHTFTHAPGALPITFFRCHATSTMSMPPTRAAADAPLSATCVALRHAHSVLQRCVQIITGSQYMGTQHTYVSQLRGSTPPGARTTNHGAPHRCEQFQHTTVRARAHYTPMQCVQTRLQVQYLSTHSHSSAAYTHTQSTILGVAFGVSLGSAIARPSKSVAYKPVSVVCHHVCTHAAIGFHKYSCKPLKILHIHMSHSNTSPCTHRQLFGQFESNKVLAQRDGQNPTHLRGMRE
jgi:hypothetical protein